MGLLAASGGFTRYRIVGEVKDEILRQAPDRLKKYAFVDIDHSADERSFGWVAFEDYLDNEWRSAPPEKGHYLAFSLRLDTRRVSPAVLKKHLRLALDQEKEHMKSDGKAFLSKDRKKEIAERVKLSLMARSLPIPAIFEAVWNTLDHTVWLCSTNSKVQTLFDDLFTMTFELQLEPQTPAYLAERIIGVERGLALEHVEPSQFAG
ncbi:hypothetical protein DFW101_1644 [Solidesulfovibrio carbinoliphilus subsp. oakridgensis]|uniref:Recombination-associated protein RdgC n=1 Tax=Solidesulfovibrio carbinoliphilus subsp. oakridgensis TaxID=694327 RepID=G7Q7V8_9BACT|nr:hypothetical protein [Solidesulfovibrio carbinoliphilus]EHJ47652.1 hypothetical protein DFW101_1644 [Solidesulfovibrio carbinoliphilus subsp. oakridgensis]